MADRNGRPEAEKVLRTLAGDARERQIATAWARWRHTPEIGDARVLVDGYRELALDAADMLLRQERSAREELQRMRDRANSRAAGMFLRGAVAGVIIAAVLTAWVMSR